MKLHVAFFLAGALSWPATSSLAQPKPVPGSRLYIASFSGLAMSSVDIDGSLDTEGRWTFTVTVKGLTMDGPDTNKTSSASMSFADSTALTALLSDPRLYREKGNYRIPNCLDGEQTRIDIAFKGRSHQSVHTCNVQGRSGAVATFVRTHLR